MAHTLRDGPPRQAAAPWGCAGWPMPHVRVHLHPLASRGGGGDSRSLRRRAERVRIPPPATRGAIFLSGLSGDLGRGARERARARINERDVAAGRRAVWPGLPQESDGSLSGRGGAPRLRGGAGTAPLMAIVTSDRYGPGPRLARTAPCPRHATPRAVRSHANGLFAAARNQSRQIQLPAEFLPASDPRGEVPRRRGRGGAGPECHGRPGPARPRPPCPGANGRGAR